MIGNRRVLALIPARGGSKGLPGKNIAACAGRPLIHWTLSAARCSKYIDTIAVTSDSDDILRVALRFDPRIVPIARPAALATDEAEMVPVILHALEQRSGHTPEAEQLGAHDIVVLLQPTSPLRTAADIDGAIEALGDRDSVVSVSPVQKHPWKMHTLSADGRLVPLHADEREVRRQDLPPVYAENGAIYVLNSSWFKVRKRTVCSDSYAYVMPVERSVDVDVPLDLAMASAVIGMGR